VVHPFQQRKGGRGKRRNSHKKKSWGGRRPRGKGGLIGFKKTKKNATGFPNVHSFRRKGLSQGKKEKKRGRKAEERRGEKDGFRAQPSVQMSRLNNRVEQKRGVQKGGDKKNREQNPKDKGRGGLGRREGWFGGSLITSTKKSNGRKRLERGGGEAGEKS